jgi:hypothetical protein
LGEQKLVIAKATRSAPIPPLQSNQGVAMKPEFPVPVPEIPVRDINKAVAYYQRNLGFTNEVGGV